MIHLPYEIVTDTRQSLCPPWAQRHIRFEAGGGALPGR